MGRKSMKYGFSRGYEGRYLFLGPKYLHKFRRDYGKVHFI